MKVNRQILSLVSTILLSTIVAQAGPGSSGGGQGAMDLEGNFYFLDILSKKELNRISFQPANSFNILTSVICSTKAVEKVTENFQFELDEAKKLLTAAEAVFDPKNSVDLQNENFENGPLASFLTEDDLLVTSFKLPQIQDATQIAPHYQIQIAYFYNEITYFQKQALLALKEKARGVFIKETLRKINLQARLNLNNQDLEEATYYIYTSNLNKLRKSNFVKASLSKQLASSHFQIFRADWRRKLLDLLLYPDWLSQVERVPLTLLARDGTYFDATNMIFYATTKPGTAWSIKTGKIVSESLCEP